MGEGGREGGREPKRESQTETHTHRDRERHTQSMSYRKHVIRVLTESCFTKSWFLVSCVELGHRKTELTIR